MNSYFLKIIVFMAQSGFTPTAQYGNFLSILLNFCINRRRPRKQCEKCLVHPCWGHLSDIRPKPPGPSPPQEPVLCLVFESYGSQLAVMIGNPADKIPYHRICGEKLDLCYSGQHGLQFSCRNLLSKKALCEEQGLQDCCITKSC